MSRVALILIWLYKRLVSPVFLALGVTCRHYPSCSTYTAQAIKRHGFWAGGWMGAARLSRCHPWGTQGTDPVPTDATGRWFLPWRYGRWRSTSAGSPSDGSDSD